MNGHPFSLNKKIFLVKPQNLSDHVQPSLGLGFLATALRKNGHNSVRIIDCIKDNIGYKKFEILLKKERPDYVGIQCYTYDIIIVRTLFKIVKKELPNCTTIVGGAHPSSIPVETMNYFGNLLDYAFIGEAETGFPGLIETLSKSTSSSNSVKLSKIDGLVWRHDSKEIQVNNQAFVEDLDTLGEPSWDLLKPETYPEAQHGAFFKKFPISPLFTTRGCPYACTFCAAHKVTGKLVRTHSVTYILNQIQKLYHERGIREFHIIDDNFTLKKEFAKDVLRGIIDLKLDFSIATPNGIRLETLDEELLDLFKEAGLYLISVSVEAASNRVLKKMKKGIRIEKIVEKIKMIKNKNISIAGFFIIGFPTETKEEILKTIDISKKLGLIRANYFTYLPFPGTESYKELVETQEIESVDWEKFYFMSAPYAPKGLSRKELLSLKRKAFLSFYLRPTILVKNMLSIKNMRHFFFLLKRFYHWILM